MLPHAKKIMNEQELFFYDEESAKKVARLANAQVRDIRKIVKFLATFSPFVGRERGVVAPAGEAPRR